MLEEGVDALRVGDGGAQPLRVAPLALLGDDLGLMLHHRAEREALAQPTHGLGLRGGVGVDRAHPVVDVCGDVRLGQDLIERTRERDQAPRHRQFEPLDTGEPVGFEVDQPGATRLVLLAEAVVQRSPRVAHALADLLATVDVAERHVVGTVEDAQRHDVESALPHLALEPDRRIDARGEAVRDGDRPTGVLRHADAHEMHRMRHGLRLGAQLTPFGVTLRPVLTNDHAARGTGCRRNARARRRRRW